jgi:hypothetical protein
MQSVRKYFSENIYRDFYSGKKQGNDKPKTLYAFQRVGGRGRLGENGKIVTRYAYSPNQAVRYFKNAFPKMKYIDVDALPYDIPTIKPEIRGENPPDKPTQMDLGL